MSEATQIFNPKAAHADHRNREWVTLDGGRICVKEMMAADKIFVLERSQRPIGPSGAPTIDSGSVLLWQIVVSCYQGEESEAGRIFDMTDIPVIQKLRGTDWDRLVAAIERVNSLADAEVAALEDFTPAPAADSAATSRSGVSSNSTVSLVS